MAPIRTRYGHDRRRLLWLCFVQRYNHDQAQTGCDVGGEMVHLWHAGVSTRPVLVGHHAAALAPIIFNCFPPMASRVSVQCVSSARRLGSRDIHTGSRCVLCFVAWQGASSLKCDQNADQCSPPIFAEQALAPSNNLKTFTLITLIIMSPSYSSTDNINPISSKCSRCPPGN